MFSALLWCPEMMRESKMQKTVTFANGQTLPAIGQGTW